MATKKVIWQAPYFAFSINSIQSRKMCLSSRRIIYTFFIRRLECLKRSENESDVWTKYRIHHQILLKCRGKCSVIKCVSNKKKIFDLYFIDLQVLASISPRICVITLLKLFKIRNWKYAPSVSKTFKQMWRLKFQRNFWWRFIEFIQTIYSWIKN